MQNFQKHSLWYMLAMSLVTCGLYPFAWVVDTARQLRAAGGKVPSTFFYFASWWFIIIVMIALPVINGFDFAKSAEMINSHPTLVKIFSILFNGLLFYFWFGYVRAYCQIIRHKNDNKTILAYFVLVLLSQWLSVLFNPIFKHIELLINKLIIDYPWIADIGLTGSGIASLFNFMIVYVILTNVVYFLLFQRGFNKYVEGKLG